MNLIDNYWYQNIVPTKDNTLFKRYELLTLKDIPLSSSRFGNQQNIF